MKATIIYRFFTLLFILASYISSTAQNNRIVKATEINSSEISQIQSTEEISATVIENKATKTYLVKNEEYYTSFINALEEKKEFIANNPDLKLKAEGEGWFIRINSEIKKAKLERSKLVGHEK